MSKKIQTYPWGWEETTAFKVKFIVYPFTRVEVHCEAKGRRPDAVKDNCSVCDRSVCDLAGEYTGLAMVEGKLNQLLCHECVAYFEKCGIKVSRMKPAKNPES